MIQLPTTIKQRTAEEQDTVCVIFEQCLSNLNHIAKQMNAHKDYMRGQMHEGYLNEYKHNMMHIELCQKKAKEMFDGVCPEGDASVISQIIVTISNCSKIIGRIEHEKAIAYQAEQDLFNNIYKMKLQVTLGVEQAERYNAYVAKREADAKAWGYNT